MSYEQLEQHDLFLPEEHWGDVDLASSTSPWTVLIAGALAAASIILMVTGRGAATTWLGAGLFVVFVYGYAIVSSRAIDAQNRQIRELIGSRRGPDDEPTPEGEGSAR